MTVDFGFNGRVVLITGAGGGIGSATALEASRHGARVAVLDANESAGQKTAELIKQNGGIAQAFVVDVRDEAVVESVTDDVEAALGPIYGVVAAAGITRPSPADKTSLADWNDVLGINLTGSFLTARAAARRMLERGTGGSMVFVASIAGLGGQAGRASYAASKHGVIGLARSLACDWGRMGIRVNVVNPGPVDTPLMRNAVSTEFIETTFLPRIPLGRLAFPEDESRAIVYLLSDYADYVTGEIMSIDGGMATGYLSDFK